MTMTGMNASGAGLLAVRRVAPRPVLALPARAATEGAASEGIEALPGVAGGGERVGDAAIDISDLRIEGRGPLIGPAEAIAVIGQLQAGPVDGLVAQVIVTLWDRVCAHVDLARIEAVSVAVEVLAGEDLAGPSDGVAAYSQDRVGLARRVAVGYLAAERRCSKRQVWREVGLVEALADLPSVRAVARQGVIERDKIAVVAAAIEAVPKNLATRAVEEGSWPRWSTGVRGLGGARRAG